MHRPKVQSTSYAQLLREEAKAGGGGNNKSSSSAAVAAGSKSKLQEFLEQKRARQQQQQQQANGGDAAGGPVVVVPLKQASKILECENLSIVVKEKDFDGFKAAISAGSEAFAVISMATLKPFRKMKLSAGGDRISKAPGAGGAATISEVLSYELLAFLFKAQLLKTETEIVYDPVSSKKTDYICAIDDKVVGVSVTRAFYRYDKQQQQQVNNNNNNNGNTNGKSKPHRLIFARDEARCLLEKKLEAICESTKNSKQCRMGQQILHIFCESEQIAQVLREEYEKNFSAELKQNTAVLFTVPKNANYIFI